MQDTQLSDVPPAWAIELQSAIADRLAGFELTLQSLAERLNAWETETVNAAEDSCGVSVESFPAEDPASAFVEPPDVAAPEKDVWMRAMLGDALCDDPRLSDSIRWMEENVKAGNPQALSLLGQFLVFRSAAADRKPSLLRDIGEAYYRCFPKTRDQSDAFEDALVDWIRRQCESAALPNSIELVHPGDRFDAARHSPVERGGVEVAEVLGWVVLRDGGKVYSKASVQTR